MADMEGMTMTDRFSEAVTMQSQGASIRRIAKNLNLSTRTVTDMLNPVRMTWAELKEKRPLAAEAYRLCVIGRLVQSAVAEKLGVGPEVIAKRIAAARRLLDPDAAKEKSERSGHAVAALLDAKLTEYGRCVCGLLLSATGCFDCPIGKSAADRAHDRPGPGQVFPQGGGF